MKELYKVKKIKNNIKIFYFIFFYGLFINNRIYTSIYN